MITSSSAGGDEVDRLNIGAFVIVIIGDGIFELLLAWSTGYDQGEWM